MASREVPVMVGLRLFLPENWTDDLACMARARVPKDRQTALTKPKVAIEAIEAIDRINASRAFGLQPTRASRRSPLRPNPDGSAIRLTSSSRRSLDSTILKADPEMVYADTP